METTKTAKITKRENYELLKKLVAGEMVAIEPAEVERLTEFLDHELEQLDKRKENAKKYAAKKAAQADPLSDAIKTVLADCKEMSIPDLLGELPVDLDASQQKLTSRLTKMVEDNIVSKETKSIKEEGKAARRVTFYTWVGESAE